nr:Phenylacetic acid catabolic protein [Angustibacter aerolatus]
MHDSAYEGLVEAEDDARWAFGSSFDDPLAGVDTTLPDGVDGPALAAYCLMLGDDALVLSQRLAQWATRGPELEEEVALANTGLDLIGQARLLLARAAAADPACVPVLPEGSPVPDEDRLAFFRDQFGFRNVHLVEPGERRLRRHRGASAGVQRLAARAARAGCAARATRCWPPSPRRASRSLRYHRDHAARWVVTLAGGTDESRRRTVAALQAIWPFLGEPGPHPPGRDGAARRRRGGRPRARLAAGVRRPRPGAVDGRARAAADPQRRHRGRPGRARRRAQRGDAGPARRAAERRARAPAGALVTSAVLADGRLDRAREVAATVTDPEPADADPGRPRRAAVGRARRRAPGGHHHPDLHRVPGHGDDARRPAGRPAPQRVRRRRGAHVAVAGVVDRLADRARTPGAGRARHRAARPGPACVVRPGAAGAGHPRAVGPLPAVRVARHPRACRASDRPPASRCTRAAPARSPSTTSRSLA